MTINEWKQKRQALREKLASLQNEYREHCKMRPTKQDEIHMLLSKIETGATLKQLRDVVKRAPVFACEPEQVGVLIAKLAANGRVKRLGFSGKEIVYEAVVRS
jgi:hypothetical protein